MAARRIISRLRHFGGSKNPPTNPNVPIGRTIANNGDIVLSKVVIGTIAIFGFGFQTGYLYRGASTTSTSKAGDDLYVNCDASSMFLHYNHYNYFLAAVARNGDGTPVKAIIKLVKNEPVENVEMKLVEAREPVWDIFDRLMKEENRLIVEAKLKETAGLKAAMEEEDENVEEIKSQLEELKHKLQIAKKTGSLGYAEYNKGVKLMKKIKIGSLNNLKSVTKLKNEVKGLKGYLEDLIRSKYGDKKICGTILQAEMEAIILALELVDEGDQHKSITISSDSSDGVKKINWVLSTKREQSAVAPRNILEAIAIGIVRNLIWESSLKKRRQIQAFGNDWEMEDLEPLTFGCTFHCQ